MKKERWAVIAKAGLAFLLVTTVLTAGCAVPGRGKTSGGVVLPASAVGQRIGDVLQRHAGRRTVFFDAAGKAMDALAEGRPGSVSVYTPAEDGQDNYAFDAEGVIVRHQRSYGADFAAGRWTDVPR